MNEEPKRRGWNVTVITGIFAALIAFLGNIAVTYQQGQNQLKLQSDQARNQLEIERKKLESDLIKQAITSDLESTKKMFNFYLEIQLISDPDGRMKEYLKKDENVPTLLSTGAIACYSHDQEGSSSSVGTDIYVMGIIRDLKGRYDQNGIFQPEGFENKDISKEQKFKDLCNATFPACSNGCWAGGDTGGFFGSSNR